ncbi:linear amide C-N hydrolase [Chlorobaculum sp. 24CR]|nr:linear amide C-N hydrolase [Chlorobaculum sp. 24CR]
MYYFPGFASYMPYDSAKAAETLSVGDFMQWMLSSFGTVDEVRARLNSVLVLNVDDPKFHGVPLPFHWKVADPTGKAIVIEMVENSKLNVYDAFLGVITNSPGYDWHLTNLRNYLYLTSGPRAPLTIGKLELGPLGAGSGMIGLPGDFTPPSRFVRAAALTASSRPLADARTAVFEAFRILDSFDIPVGAVTPAKATAGDIESATQITSISDLNNVRYYFTTMRNREVRMIDLKKIDFAKVREQMIDGDEGRLYPVRELKVR